MLLGAPHPIMQSSMWKAPVFTTTGSTGTLTGTPGDATSSGKRHVCDTRSRGDRRNAWCSQPTSRTLLAVMVAGATRLRFRVRAQRAVCRSALESSRSVGGGSSIKAIVFKDVVDAVFRVLIPASLIGVIGGLTFCPAALSLRSMLAEPTLQVIRDDMTQFTQNSFSAAGLLLILILAETIDINLSRLEQLYDAILNELTQAEALIEQLSLIGATRLVTEESGSRTLLDDLEEYIQDDLCLIGQPRLLQMRDGNAVDRLERVLFATSVGLPSDILVSIRKVRLARAARLAACQRTFPLAHYVILGAFAVYVLGFLVLLGAGLSTFEKAGEAELPGHLLWLLAPLFGLIVGAVTITLLVLRELSDKERGLFGVDPSLKEAVRGLMRKLQGRRAESVSMENV